MQVWPTSVCAEIQAGPKSLTIRYPPSRDFPDAPVSHTMVLHIGALPFMQLDGNSFASNRESLPGLDVELKGSVADNSTKCLRFASNTRTHGAYHYVLQFEWKGDIGVPELVIQFEKTTPPQYPLLM